MASSKSEGTEAKIREYFTKYPDATLQEIGEFAGVSRQWVHALLKKMNLDNQRLPRKPKLTNRQLEILNYVARGYTDKQIGEALGCIAQSIRNQLRPIYAKLNVHKRKHAVQAAIEQGLMPPI